MRIAVFDSHGFERETFRSANAFHNHSISFFEPRLTASTAILAQGFDVACSFANDVVDDTAIANLADGGVKLIALRTAGFNHVDLRAAKARGIPVVRVPEYSPYSVAEHAVALVLTLNRKIHRAYNRIRELNFTLDGLVGFDLHGKTVGIVGTGRIGRAAARIFRGFGCQVLAFDLCRSDELEKEGIKYVPLSELFGSAQIISLHLPLTPGTLHMISEDQIRCMQRGVMIINTGRGGLIDTPALINGLKSGQIGSAGLDVYEEEEGVFFQNLSATVLQDDVLARLLTFPNVLITSHQGFLTTEALQNIAETTLANVTAFEQGRTLINEILVN